VIEHPKGTVLWDGGLPSATAATPGWSPEVQGSSVRLDKTLAQQLSNMKFDLSSFDYVAFSHIHFDHVGVANEIKNATWLVQEADFDAAFLPEGEPPGPGVQPDLLREIRNSETLKLNGDHDVFGDGRVRLISASGHTPGHQVLFIDLQEYGPLVLSGDLYHFRFNRAQRRVPLFNVNVDQTLAAMDKVESLVTEEGAQFWIEHDLALFKTLKTAPDFYR
jgi:glyoxylase-like metal-dependent hydrolase (beta-lactamase superfamily II)